MRAVVFALFAAVHAAPATADPVADVLQRAQDACAEFENGEFRLAEGAVTKLDLTGDGAPETIVDESKYECSSAASLYCGTGGCMLHVEARGELSSWQATGWKAIEWGPTKILLIGRDGGWCGGAGSEVCFEAVNWSAGRFLTVGPAPE